MRNSRTVLVVDDDVPIRRIIEIKMRMAGYQVLSAANGEEGLALIRSEKPDAVIADVSMPKLTGRDMCELSDPLKKERRFLTIIVTGMISSEERRWMEPMTDTMFLEKPFSPMRMLEMVDEYFGVNE